MQGRVMMYFTLNEDGMWVNGRSVGEWNFPDMGSWMDTIEFYQADEGDEDEVYPTHHENLRQRREYDGSGRCTCQYCVAEGDQSHGFRSRGPKQVPHSEGHRLETYGLWPVRVGSYESWKDHRRYQARDRVPLPYRVDIVDVLQGLYPKAMYV